jgi:uncharacterized protein (TIGR02391 family)
MDRKTTRNIRAHFSRLAPLEKYLEDEVVLPSSEAADNFVSVIRHIERLVDADLSFLCDNVEGYDDDVDYLKLRVSQAISYLSARFSDELGVEQTNLILETLRDETLKRRCIDLLLAEDDFDRAVNQATQVLEDRIRKKSGSTSLLTGSKLSNEMIKRERSETVLVLSNDDSEQQGYADIIRGIMAAHRNPSHHFIYNMDRLDAARICAYIDVLLEMLDNSELNPPRTGGAR